MAGEDLPGLGQAHVAADTLDQDGAGALLEPAHHLGDGRLGVPRDRAAPVKLPSSAMARITRRPAASIMPRWYNG